MEHEWTQVSYSGGGEGGESNESSRRKRVYARGKKKRVVCSKNSNDYNVGINGGVSLSIRRGIIYTRKRRTIIAVWPTYCTGLAAANVALLRPVCPFAFIAFADVITLFFFSISLCLRSVCRASFRKVRGGNAWQKFPRTTPHFGVVINKIYDITP